MCVVRYQFGSDLQAYWSTPKHDVPDIATGYPLSSSSIRILHHMGDGAVMYCACCLICVGSKWPGTN